MDYLESSRPAPKGPGRITYGNYVPAKKAPMGKPARYCVCGQKLSIANEGTECFRCRRRKN